MTSTAATGDRAPVAPLVAGMCAAGILLGWASAVAPRLALVAAVAAAGVAAVTRHPALLAVAAVPGALAARRLDLALVDLTYSDALVAAAGVCALPVIVSRRLRHGAQPVLWALAGYLACLGASLVVNPSARGVLEWLHRLALVGGSLAIGVVLVHAGLHRRALRLLTIAAVFVASAAIQYSATHGWAAAYPLGLHKNFIGSIFATVLVVLLVSPESVHLPPAAWRVAVVVIGAGLLAAKSRGGMLAVGIAVAVWFVRSRRAESSAARLGPFVVAAVLATVALLSLRGQLAERSQVVGPRFDSISHRQEVERATRDVWRTSPILGQGLRFYQSGRFPKATQPPNIVIDEALAEAGVAGLAGLLLLQGVAFRTLARRAGPLALAGLCALIARFAHGQFDIYWIAGVTSLPWIIAGMGLADVDEGSDPDSEVTPGR